MSFDKINPVPAGEPVPAVCPIGLCSPIFNPTSNPNPNPVTRSNAMRLMVPQKLPKVIGFDPSECDLTQVNPMVTAACKCVGPAIESIGNIHKSILDRLPEFVDEMLGIDGDDVEAQDEVIERYNADYPVEVEKGKAFDWRGAAELVLPILTKFITDLLTPKAGKSRAANGKGGRK